MTADPVTVSLSSADWISVVVALADSAEYSRRQGEVGAQRHAERIAAKILKRLSPEDAFRLKDFLHD